MSPRAQDAFANVTSKDEERLGKRFVRLHVLHPRPIDALAAALEGGAAVSAMATKWREQRSGLLRGKELCTCVALRGSVLSSVRCSVYENRPEVCRSAVKPGDRTCRLIRNAYLKYTEDNINHGST